MNLYCCGTCGGTDVAEAAWGPINRPALKDERWHDESERTYYFFCYDCGDFCKVIY